MSPRVLDRDVMLEASLFDALEPSTSPSTEPADVSDVVLRRPDDIDGLFDALRRLLRNQVAPESVRWFDGQPSQDSLWAVPGAARDAKVIAKVSGKLDNEIRLPRAFVDLARSVALHASSDRFMRLHSMAAQILADRRVWDDTLRPDRLQLERMANQVRREIHKMHAFVRFREVDDDGERCHVAWFEPEHHIVRAAAPFFAKRFASMRWAILTPRGSVRWDRRVLKFGPPADRSDAPAADDGEALWLAYYRAIFNPARIKLSMMRREMPTRYWRNLPETAQMTSMLHQAPVRVHAMQTQVDGERVRRRARGACASTSASAAGEPRASYSVDSLAAIDAGNASVEGPFPRPRLRGAAALAVLQQQAQRCDRCPFAADATQVVWGEGAADASLMLVGEQPGDREDLAGRVFVGPAGQLLRRAIDALGWPPQQLYFTNAVKHFKYEMRGKRRMHKTASQREAAACADWLEAEIAAVRPKAIVALGATAAASLLGERVSITRAAGTWLSRSDGTPVLIVPHPSAVLRAQGPARGATGDGTDGDEAAWTNLLSRAGDVLAA